MKSFLAAAAIAAVVLTPAAHADCTYPQSPGRAPDGNTATLAEMLAAQQAVSSYNQQMTAYLSCIQLERDSRVAQAGDKLTKDQKEELEIIETQKHNAAIDQLHAIADAFNAQVRVFKARDKKPDSDSD